MKYRIAGIKKGSPIDVLVKLLGCALFVEVLIWFFRIYILSQGAM